MTKARDIANAGTALAVIDATELAFLDGVTSAVQTQINSKIAQATAINPAIVDAKGDIVAATAADTVARLAVGANNTVLTADSAEATGLKWAAPAGGGKSFTLLNAGGTALSGNSTVTVSGISNADDIYIFGNNVNFAAASNTTICRINTDSSSKYGDAGFVYQTPASYTASRFSVISHLPNGNTGFPIADQANNASDQVDFSIRISGAASTNLKLVTVMSAASNSSGSGGVTRYYMGQYSGTSVVSSISIVGSASYAGGTVFVYTSA